MFTRLASPFITCMAFAALATGCASVEEAPPDPARLTAGGIGAMVRADDTAGALAIDKLATKGAGASAGLRLYELIFAIDGTPTRDEAFEASVARLRGPVGTKVRLLVGTSESDAREVVVVRAELPPDVLECLAGDCQGGTGTSVNRFGDRYDGEFQGGRYHGQGKMVEPSGRTYEGSWVEGAASGEGVYVSATGLRIEGSFDRGYPTGSVKMTFPNGDVYEGDSDDFTMHGQGKLTRPSTGDVWEGTFERGSLIDGSWMHYPADGDGRTCTRAVRNGEVMANGRIDYAPKDKKKKVRFEGAFGDDCVANGEGLMTYERKKMAGPFANDEPQKGAKTVR